MRHTLPSLPYPYDALEPSIDKQTMILHHTKHHQGYVDNLNKAIEPYNEFQSKSIETLLRDLNSLPVDIKKAVQNHGGGHYNHSLFWAIMMPHAPQEPEGDLQKEMKKIFSSFSEFKEKFSKAALTQFGSGWAWLCVDSKKKLVICQKPNQECPLADNMVPILGLDVWEHAYYLKYQNRRVEYIEAWWNVVNWSEVAKRYQEAVR